MKPGIYRTRREAAANLATAVALALVLWLLVAAAIVLLSPAP